jgi:hypothetical protein
MRRRWSREAGEVPVAPPQPLVVGAGGLVPEPCVLHPEQVVSHPFAGLSPEEPCARIDAREEDLEEEAGQSTGGSTAGPPPCRYDLPLPARPAGGFASWDATGPRYPVNCLSRTARTRLLLTVDASEWDGGSGSRKPPEDRDRPAHRCATPTEVTVGRRGELNVFAYPDGPERPHPFGRPVGSFSTVPQPARAG